MVNWFDELPSTQDVAHRMAQDGVPHGAAVAARVQTAGRGTRGRSWISSRGGLWMSVVCRPAPGPGHSALGIRVALVLADFLDSLPFDPSTRPSARPSVRLKWPNDLLLGDTKLGGILSEARWQGERVEWLVVGIGLNVHNPLPHDPGLEATRLADHGFAGTKEELAEPIAGLVAQATASAPLLEEFELAAFAARDALRDRPVIRPRPGFAAGIGSSGRLRIRTPNGTTVEVDDRAALQLA